MSPETRLLQLQLGSLTPRALSKIEASLQRGGPILVGAWQARVHGQKCGCLMMDGYAGRSRHGTSIHTFLAERYGLDTSPDAPRDHVKLLEHAARAFDAWANAEPHRTRRIERTHGFPPVTVLSGRGKRECLAIVRRVQRHKAKEAA